MFQKEMSASVLAIIFVAPTVFLAVLPTVSAQEELPDEVTLQQTKTSTQDPLPGHEGHQLVMALPPRNDGLIWDGDVTWVASKPVEVVVLQGYNSSAVSNQTSAGSNQTSAGSNQTSAGSNQASAEFGEPLKAPFGGGEVAITLVKPESGTPVPSGSMPFVGNALAFHTLGGEKFSVTYSIHATADELTEMPGEEEESDEG